MTIKGSVEGKPEGGGEGDRHGYNWNTLYTDEKGVRKPLKTKGGRKGEWRKNNTEGWIWPKYIMYLVCM
jgi:hypothetical protein